jgi:hypothetical protein
MIPEVPEDLHMAIHVRPEGSGGDETAAPASSATASAATAGPATASSTILRIVLVNPRPASSGVKGSPGLRIDGQR